MADVDGKVCAPCSERGGFAWDVLTLAEAEERVRTSEGRLRSFRCLCGQPDVWHTTPRYGLSRVAFSDSGP